MLTNAFKMLRTALCTQRKHVASFNDVPSAYLREILLWKWSWTRCAEFNGSSAQNVF